MDRVSALRSTWRKSAEHFAEQVWRFIRLTILAAIPSLASALFSKHFDWKTLLAFILPFAEVAFRQVWPALGAKRADEAPGTVTVVDGPDDVPVQTDNGPRPEDGDQSNVIQDPDYIPPSVDVGGESTDPSDLS